MSTINWRGVLAPMDTPSTDKRVIASPLIGASIHRPLPLSVFETDSGRVGWINRIWIADNNIMAEGILSSLVTTPLEQGWFTGGLDLTEGDWEDEPDGIQVLRNWKISGFHIHTIPAFEQTRLEYV